MSVFHNYFNKNKTKILDWVTDWTSGQDHIRYQKDVSSISFTDWFFCHPSAFKLINYGSDLMSLLLFSFVGGWFYYKEYNFIVVVCLIMNIFLLRSLIKKLWNRKAYSETTYYDLYMREYNIDWPESLDEKGMIKKVK